LAYYSVQEPTVGHMPQLHDAGWPPGLRQNLLSKNST